MCGIIGYVGGRAGEAAAPQGLQRLEYRGYDSAGIALPSTTASTTCARSATSRT